MKHVIDKSALFILLTSIAACTTLPRNPVVVDKMLEAKISGIPNVRAWSGKFSKSFENDLLLSIEQDKRYRLVQHTDPAHASNMLLLSGGGDYGAFGAGFLQGWSKSGTRPEFKLVTGISTGALMAAFAFLGPEYDGVIKQAYTTTNASNIYFLRWVSFLWSDSFTNTAPFVRLIERYITQDILDKVALAHRQGRRLLIGTTNLDADRLVVWNMGVIANSGHPEALALFRQVILASSSIPAVFPPVLIEVDVDGTPYDEMHVDGGVKAQLFLVAATLDLADFSKKVSSVKKTTPRRSIYIIRNGEIQPEPKQVKRNLIRITKRSFSSLIKAQAMSDLERIYNISKEYDLDFNLVAIPADFKLSGSIGFSGTEMNRLFKIGYEQGLKKEVWLKHPATNQ